MLTSLPVDDLPSMADSAMGMKAVSSSSGLRRYIGKRKGTNEHGIRLGAWRKRKTSGVCLTPLSVPVQSRENKNDAEQRNAHP